MTVNNISRFGKMLNFIKNHAISNFQHILLLILAFLCFLPPLLGYNFVADIYTNNLASLSNSTFSYSLVGSIAATVPLLIGNISEFVTSLYLTNLCVVSQNEITFFRFPTVMILLVTSSDLLLLTYVVPYQQFDWLPSVIGCRDILFTWTFAFSLNKLSPLIWTPKMISLVMFCSVSLNWTYSWISMSVPVEVINNTVLLGLQYALISFMIFLLLFVTIQWFIHIYHTNKSDEPSNLSVVLTNLQTSIFSIFLCIYIFCDFIPALAITAESEDWYAYGVTYLTMLTYMMAASMLCVNIMTTTIGKIGTIAISQVLILSLINSYFQMKVFYLFIINRNY